MTPEQIRRLRDLHDLATAGPWEVTEDDNGDGYPEIGIWAPKAGGTGEYVAENITSTTAKNDAEAIVEAHNRLPDLLAQVKRQREHLDKVGAVHNGCPNTRDDIHCPWCRIAELEQQASGWSAAQDIVERAVRKGYDIGGAELGGLAKAFALNGGAGQ
ncbi:hypothetical protein [Actinoallomurus sp. CA-142502]|uniref:hypothetical protein n=1 Tax=Actinoallomurus sp. CA-142502 TaxID=3239885 RepID=UPI003D8C2D5D